MELLVQKSSRRLGLTFPDRVAAGYGVFLTAGLGGVDSCLGAIKKAAAKAAANVEFF
jgi:hypothetical protein